MILRCGQFICAPAHQDTYASNIDIGHWQAKPRQGKAKQNRIVNILNIAADRFFSSQNSDAYIWLSIDIKKNDNNNSNNKKTKTCRNKQ